MMTFNYNSQVKPSDRVEPADFMPHEDQKASTEEELDLFDALSLGL